MVEFTKIQYIDMKLKKLKIDYLNIYPLQSKIDIIRDLTLQKDTDILVLSETWLSPQRTNDMLHIPVFNILTFNILR